MMVMKKEVVGYKWVKMRRFMSFCEVFVRFVMFL